MVCETVSASVSTAVTLTKVSGRDANGVFIIMVASSNSSYYSAVHFSAMLYIRHCVLGSYKTAGSIALNILLF
jgi:hypothetical protein